MSAFNLFPDKYQLMEGAGLAGLDRHSTINWSSTFTQTVAAKGPFGYRLASVDCCVWLEDVIIMGVGYPWFWFAEGSSAASVRPTFKLIGFLIGWVGFGLLRFETEVSITRPEGEECNSFCCLLSTIKWVSVSILGGTVRERGERERDRSWMCIVEIYTAI